MKPLTRPSRSEVVPAPITTNTIPVTQQAQQIFVRNAEDLNQVRQTIDSVLSELTNSGTSPVSLNQVTTALQQWEGALDDIISLSQWMADTLETTWQLIQKNEQDNTDLAAGLTVQPEPAGSRIPGGSGGNTTVAPGQTIGFFVSLEEPAAPG